MSRCHSTLSDPYVRHCGHCGKSLGTACARCAFVNSGDSRFCGGCGAKFLTQQVEQAPEVERFAIPFW
jgi:hypothetical protein